MSLIETTRQQDVVTLELNRPEKRNALSPDLIAAMHGALDVVELDASIRVVILGGLGKCFCAGMDLRGGAGSMDLRRLSAFTLTGTPFAPASVARAPLF